MKTAEYLCNKCNIGMQRKPLELENKCYYSILIITGNQKV